MLSLVAKSFVLFLTFSFFLLPISNDNLHAQNSTTRFAEENWIVRGYPGNPGDNDWSSGEQAVWFDDSDRDGKSERIRLAVAQVEQVWSSAEVMSASSMDYGLYCFTVEGAIDEIDTNVVFGLFLLETETAGNDLRDEVDIEFTKWGNPSRPTNANYVLQPGHAVDNSDSIFYSAFVTAEELAYNFNINLPLTVSTHCIDWSSDRVIFESYSGTERASNNQLQTVVLADSPDARNYIPEPSRDVRILMQMWLVNCASDPARCPQPIQSVSPNQVQAYMGTSDGSLAPDGETQLVQEMYTEMEVRCDDLRGRIFVERRFVDQNSGLPLLNWRPEGAEGGGAYYVYYHDYHDACQISGNDELRVGGRARVHVTDDGLKLREGPDVSYNWIEKLISGTIVDIIGGPQMSGGYVWWHVQSPSGAVGWSVDGADGLQTLIPSSTYPPANDGVLEVYITNVTYNRR